MQTIRNHLKHDRDEAERLARQQLTEPRTRDRLQELMLRGLTVNIQQVAEDYALDYDVKAATAGSDNNSERSYSGEDIYIAPDNGSLCELDVGFDPLQSGADDSLAATPVGSQDNDLLGALAIDDIYPLEVPGSPVSMYSHSSDNIHHDLFEAQEDLPHEDGEEDDELDINILDDPLFVSREDVFDNEEEPEDTEDDDSTSNLPPAFDEDPLIRNAYINAFIAASFHHATHDLVQHILESQYDLFISLSDQTGHELRGLENMARTLHTVERCLGIDPDKFIIYHFLCNVCWYRHHPSELSELKSPNCMQPDCPGILYTTKKLSNGHMKRTLVKIFPSMPLTTVIQRMLLRPGKYAELQQWRKPGDEPGRVAPLAWPIDGWDAFPDPDVRMCDIYDG
ncbi:hypothetical protein SCP_0213000 [Sparassis crispa]|uniref:Uncharacterized protein n=1 Tax=Sparassis crispa TaxID=139825 RepID=A0A401GD54_9APHY|nr:hypothetical protein SCP_0213000 [Sparassis crispa]GBE80097.1 hypothetical protein SCP_0213000 [Sparassis crispa]